MLSRREGAAVKTESIVGCDLFATALASASFSAAPRAARTAAAVVSKASASDNASLTALSAARAYLL